MAAAGVTRLIVCKKPPEQPCGQAGRAREDGMPYIEIQVTREGVNAGQKAALIRGATEPVVRVLGKDPATTFMVIDEVDTDNRGVGGQPLGEWRRERGGGAS